MPPGVVGIRNENYEIYFRKLMNILSSCILNDDFYFWSEIDTNYYSSTGKKKKINKKNL